ncbi:hypothetical protein [Nocardia sp. XZ_19_385]|uniref:hypothetical protein n=1 Tax=Nocardia sp. XZ_19_385 TaxID=2769488 RepID=UPI00188E2258|nr:hypothetical protein [Nocardia sp. XZ_19_385]
MATRSDPQPPFSPELLADLHADNLTPEVSAELWPVVRKDPEARSYLNSLDEVNAALRALAGSDRAPEPMPADVAARLESFAEELESAEEPAAPAERPDAPISLAERRGRRLRWLAAAAAGVVLLTGAGFAIQLFRDAATTPGTPTAQPPTSAPVDDDVFPASVALAALGRFEVTGALADRPTLSACVAAAGLGDRKLLGSTDMRFKGAEAVLILLSGPDGRKITALVVGTNCTPGDPQVKNVTDIG